MLTPDLGLFYVILPLCKGSAHQYKNLCLYFQNTTLNYLCQKTVQMGTLKRFAYIFLYNYAITIYSISLQSYDKGLLDKHKYITLPLVVLDLQPKHCKSPKHLNSFLRHCTNQASCCDSHFAWNVCIVCKKQLHGCAPVQNLEGCCHSAMLYNIWVSLLQTCIRF